MGVILSRITLIKPQTQKTQRVCFLEKGGCLIEGAPTARILYLWPMSGFTAFRV